MPKELFQPNEQPQAMPGETVQETNPNRMQATMPTGGVAPETWDLFQQGIRLEAFDSLTAWERNLSGIYIFTEISVSDLSKRTGFSRPTITKDLTSAMAKLYNTVTQQTALPYPVGSAIQLKPKQYRSPLVKQSQAQKMAANWRDQEYRDATISSIRDAIKGSPESLKARADRMRQLWQNPDIRPSLLENAVAVINSPVAIKKRAESLRDLWHDPDARQQMLALTDRTRKAKRIQTIRGIIANAWHQEERVVYRGGLKKWYSGNSSPELPKSSEMPAQIANDALPLPPQEIALFDLPDDEPESAISIEQELWQYDQAHGLREHMIRLGYLTPEESEEVDAVILHRQKRYIHARNLLEKYSIAVAAVASLLDA